MRKILIPGGLVLILVVISVSVFILTRLDERPACACQLPPKTIWRVQDEQIAVTNENELFALKDIYLQNSAFHFFYVTKSQRDIEPIIELFSMVESGEQRSLQIEVQNLGKMGEFSTGVITTPHSNQKGQELSLRVAFPGTDTEWKLTFLHQVASEEEHGPVLDYNDFYDINSKEILFDGPVLTSDQELAYAFFYIKSEEMKDTERIFMQISKEGKVEVIAQEQYVSVIGENRLTPNVTN